MLLGLCFVISIVQASAAKSYVVYLGSSPESLDKNKLIESHHALLKPVLKSSQAVRRAILYSFTHGFNGFAAKLLPEQADKISKTPGVVSVFRNKKNYLHTTRSWEFMGLEKDGEIPSGSLWNRSNFGNDVIIGVLDTGIWPESESFNDDSFTPIPNRWKGGCVSGTSFNASSHCNKKLIGARYYIKAYELENGPLNTTATGSFRSPRDKDGHGTQTSSIAAGRFVRGANALGFANGTAKGGAAFARISMYKVCWPTTRAHHPDHPDHAAAEDELEDGDHRSLSECYDADILAAMDDAVRDGVDVLSLSIGGDSSSPLPQLFEDGISVGAFHAVQKGITVVCSAGNAGPGYGSVVNVAPWILTVAASSSDRSFSSFVVLGDNTTTYKGESLSDSALNVSTSYPLVSGGDIADSSANASDSLLCKSGALNPAKANGSIVICLRGSNSRVSKGEAVRLAGGVGMILANSVSEGGSFTVADAHVLPATNVDAKSAVAIFAYLNSSSSPTATITAPATLSAVKPAPTMASFSSQGPNSLIPDILKPDITAPGMNILAAFTQAASPSGLPTDSRVVKFKINSGTSMACSHVTGVAALLKALHPEWSPAAIRSAIMTTAHIHDNREQLILGSDSHIAGPLNYGSGHVHPNAAANPGLVYDSTSQDYLLLLCSLRYNSSVIKTLAGQPFSCPPPSSSREGGAVISSFNYPSIAVSKLQVRSVTTVTRTLTNVANCSSTYEAFVKAPFGVVVSVRPSKLTFSSIGQTQSFAVELSVKQGFGGGHVFGYLIWSDGKHQVRSSIAVNSNTPSYSES